MAWKVFFDEIFASEFKQFDVEVKVELRAMFCF